MKKCVIDIVLVSSMCLSVFASSVALPTQGAIKDGENVTVRPTIKCASCGGARLVVVMDESEETAIVNSDIVNNSADSVATLLRYVIIAGCSVLFVFIVWILWPLVSFARLLSHRAASRYFDAVQDVNSSPHHGGSCP